METEKRNEKLLSDYLVKFAHVNTKKIKGVVFVLFVIFGSFLKVCLLFNGTSDKIPFVENFWG